MKSDHPVKLSQLLMKNTQKQTNLVTIIFKLFLSFLSLILKPNPDNLMMFDNHVICIHQQSQQYSMSLYENKHSFFQDNNRTTMFPSLRSNFQNRGFRQKNVFGMSLDEKTYRMTSNQLLKGLIKQNDSEIKKLRKTFMKQNLQEQKAKKIGIYKIVKEIGKGGFATVFEVEDDQGKRYALKQYNLQQALECYHNEVNVGSYFFEKGQIRKQFQEVEGSNNLIRFIDQFRIGKFGYIVQQLSQHSFSKFISDIQGIFFNTERVYEVKFKEFYYKLATENQLTKIMIDLCNAVNIINQQGFLHCDLKLENLMIQFEQNQPVIKLIDFGSTFERQQGLPKITITPEYMPPELLIMLENGNSDYQLLKKVDVWSIGCILLEIVTGIPLWFRYKCKVQIKGKTTLQLGFFALTGRDYSKIVRRQRQLVQNLAKTPFTLRQFDKYRSILKKLLVLNPNKRISLEDCVQQLQKLHE